VSNGFSLYRFVVVKADVKHLPALVASLRFIANSTGEVSDLRNVLVYAPPAQAMATSPFIVSGIARVFENTVSLKVVNEDEETVWTGFTTANAPDVGTYGGYSAIVDLSGTELTAGDRVRLEVFQSSAKDGSEIDKVVVPLELKEVQATQVVEAYFGSGPGGSADDCTTVLAVERHVPKTLAVARAALDELMKGPTLREREEGYFTSLPPGVVVQRLVIAEGVAQADFTPALEQGVGGSCRVLAIRAQIEKTLRQFPSVQSVVISIDGRTEDILQP
ncbi:MAG: GerMN domain-containing protein, partial [Candidatus Veblenbacteria bacterium]|nr:GerMN domain-containing protein [Candidatus Veblenbacteria bacterium]